VLIIGGGPTGLSAAYHCGKDALLLEQNDRVGGLCRSLRQGGFTFDYAGHIMYAGEPYVQELYRILLGDNVQWRQREAWIYHDGLYTRYPFQNSLYGLPPQVIKECLLGIIQARYGALPSGVAAVADATNSAAASKAAPRCRSDRIEDCCGEGILESTAELGPSQRSVGPPSDTGRPPANFEEFIYRAWGAGIARHFAIPYNTKFWTMPLAEIETSWLGGRVPLPDLDEVLDGALQAAGKPEGAAGRIGYPRRGGFQALMDGFLPWLGDRVRLGARVVGVSPSRRTVALADGATLGYERLISTMPLPRLVCAMGDEVPHEVRAAAAALRHVSVRCVHLGIGREQLTEKHWIYYPGDTVFHRLFVQGNASADCNPPGGFGLTCEITYSKSKPLPCEGTALVERCIADCRRVGILRADDPIWETLEADLPYAHVVYDHQRAGQVAVIRDWLAGQQVIPAGRYGEWEYYNADHAFLAGKRAAETVRQARP